MYDPQIVQPMREELTSVGFEELTTAKDVDNTLATGTVLVVINSVCGCAAGNARPGATLAAKNPKRPEKLTTVFAGQDKEATDKARSYFHGYPPSSPSMALLKDGQIVHFISRQQIEGHSPEEIAANLTSAFEQHCN